MHMTCQRVYSIDMTFMRHENDGWCWRLAAGSRHFWWVHKVVPIKMTEGCERFVNQFLTIRGTQKYYCQVIGTPHGITGPSVKL